MLIRVRARSPRRFDFGELLDGQSVGAMRALLRLLLGRRLVSAVRRLPLAGRRRHQSQHR
jgi:hypothetical protein